MTKLAPELVLCAGDAMHYLPDTQEVIARSLNRRLRKLCLLGARSDTRHLRRALSYLASQLDPEIQVEFPHFGTTTMGSCEYFSSRSNIVQFINLDCFGYPTGILFWCRAQRDSSAFESQPYLLHGSGVQHDVDAQCHEYDRYDDVFVFFEALRDERNGGEPVTGVAE